MARSLVETPLLAPVFLEGFRGRKPRDREFLKNYRGD